MIQLPNPCAIQAILDATLPAGQQLRQAQAILDPLSAVDLAELRAAVRQAYLAGQPRFRCAGCGGALFVAQNPAGPGVPADGRGAHFKHYATPDAPPCAQRSAANVRDIGAVKFAGLAEGANHAELKRLLALCLSQDPDITDIQIERQIRAANGSWRQPDVSAVIRDTLVAFDQQLAGASLVSILERGQFYAANGVCHVWLTDAADLSRLSQLAFRDLHLTMGGRIFAIDSEVVAACVQHAKFQLKELSIAPRLAPLLPLHNVWEVALVDADVIVMDQLVRKREGETRYRKALSTQVNERFGPERTLIRKAAAQCKNLGWVAPQWARIATQIKGHGVEIAKLDQVSEVLAWLHTVEIYVTSADPTLRPVALEGLQAATERLLTVRNAKDWAPLVDTTGKILPMLTQAFSADNRARLTKLLATTERVLPVIRIHAGMLAVLYPWPAFRLIARAPKFAPPLRDQSAR